MTPIRAWPLANNFVPMIQGASGGPVAIKRTFEPSVGIDTIERPAVTARMERWTNLSFIVETKFENDLVESWFYDTIGQGAKSFIFRHPRTGDLGEWKITTDPVFSNISEDKYIITVDMIKLAGTLWFAPYVPTGSIRIPRFVADYDGDVYGVDGARGVAADLADVSGTFEVWTTFTDGRHAFGTKTYSGDVPLTAPTGVSRLVGFEA